MADHLEDHVLKDLLSRAPEAEMNPQHREWINEQVRNRLAKIESGEMTFKSLDEVRRKFGFDAY